MDESLECTEETLNTGHEELTAEQKRRILRNKERALALKEQRRLAKPYDRPDSPKGKNVPLSSSTYQPSSSSRDTPPQPSAFRNSHAGFMFNDEDTSVQRHEYRRVEDDGMSFNLCSVLNINKPSEHFIPKHTKYFFTIHPTSSLNV